MKRIAGLTKRTIILALALVFLVAGVAACGTSTTLPPDTPEWQELMTVSSDELAPAVTIPEGEFYNTSWFGERPLVQSFDFSTDWDWRFTITVSGEVSTRFEVYTSIALRGGGASSYGYDQTFTLSSETETFTRELLLAEGQEPPADVEIKVLSDAPMDWEMVIEY